MVTDFRLSVTCDDISPNHGVNKHALSASCRSPVESVPAGFLLLHGGDGGEAEPAEPHRDQSSRL